MTCTTCLETLNDLLDGAIHGDRRREVDAHLQACPSCAAAYDDIGRIRQLASSLDRLPVPPSLWQRVEAATSGAVRDPWYRRKTFWTPVATAACLILAVALVYVVQQGLGRGGADQGGSGSAAVTTVGEHPELQSVATELQKAEQHYENAIRGLERLANDKQVLDPQVAASLQQNLLVIDVAIDESRAAVRAQPTSELAQQSLFEAFRTKIVVLQDTIALINEMRKGNQAEAARLAESLNNKS